MRSAKWKVSLSHKANSEQVDVDGSGAVEWEEFCVLIYKKMREKDSDNEIKEAFRVFDAEGTGLIGECRDGTLLNRNVSRPLSAM